MAGGQLQKTVSIRTNRGIRSEVMCPPCPQMLNAQMTRVNTHSQKVHTLACTSQHTHIQKIYIHTRAHAKEHGHTLQNEEASRPTNPLPRYPQTPKAANDDSIGEWPRNNDRESSQSECQQHDRVQRHSHLKEVPRDRE